ncbi:MAG: hypothetical protein V4689_04385 [Verrucomicrobiota bacterium]
MIKRTSWILAVLVGMGTIFWLSRSYKLVKIDPTVAGQIQKAKHSTKQASDSSDGQIVEIKIPESSKEDAIRILKSIVDTQNIRSTDLVSIRVRHTNKEEARDITAQVAKAYKEYRSEVESRDSSKSLNELDQAVRDQEAKVEDRRKVLATIVRSKGIIYRGPDSFYGQSGTDEDQGARNALQTYNNLQTQKMQLESQINSLLKYHNDELIRYASGLDLPDNTVKVLYPQYLEAKREQELLKRRGLGDRHPTLLAQDEQVQAIELQMNESVVNLRATLQAQLDMATDHLKKAEVAKKEAHEEAIKRGLDAQDYVDAKRDFETDQQLLQEMKLKQISEKVKAER